VIQLSRAEARAFAAYLVGGSEKEAAAILGLTRGTVAEHLAHIRERAGAKTNAEAAWILALAKDAAIIEQVYDLRAA
jgi:DNA-binding CsgD family transcriptional regulator